MFRIPFMIGDQGRDIFIAGQPDTDSLVFHVKRLIGQRKLVRESCPPVQGPIGQPDIMQVILPDFIDFEISLFIPGQFKAQSLGQSDGGLIGWHDIGFQTMQPEIVEHQPYGLFAGLKSITLAGGMPVEMPAGDGRSKATMHNMRKSHTPDDPLGIIFDEQPERHRPTGLEILVLLFQVVLLLLLGENRFIAISKPWLMKALVTQIVVQYSIGTGSIQYFQQKSLGMKNRKVTHVVYLYRLSG